MALLFGLMVALAAFAFFIGLHGLATQSGTVAERANLYAAPERLLGQGDRQRPLAHLFRVVERLLSGQAFFRRLELHLAQRMESDDLELVVAAITISHDAGGRLSHVLEKIADTVMERVRLQGEIRVLTTQQRLTSYLLAAMPFILAAAASLEGNSMPAQPSIAAQGDAAPCRPADPCGAGRQAPGMSQNRRWDLRPMRKGRTAAG